ncbi:MAG: SWIM zinc finger family protein [Myxococcota bacterium]
MSTEEPGRTPITQRYRSPSAVAESTVQLMADVQRDPVRVEATVADPVAFREALLGLADVVKSDLRYKPRDRTAYVAWTRMKQRSVGLATWRAQRDYFDWLARNDPLAWYVLDPVVTVHPDAVLFEVFSKDEGTYAQLRLDRDAFGEPEAWQCGTTNIDFSDDLQEGLKRLRSYRNTSLSIGSDAVRLTTGDAEVVEKRVQVPDTWLRGFLQVQSSVTLARAGLRLKPIELYNVLRHLRLHGDSKGQGRALRVELTPGQVPRLVIEPREVVIETTSGPYAGLRSEVIKIWGRRRWSLIRRMLPFAREVELHLVGSGLPSFLVLRAPGMAMTLGLTGFSAANWARSLQFDVLLPRAGGTPAEQTQVLDVLRQDWVSDAATLASRTGLSTPQTIAALQAAGQNGWVMFDLAAGRIRLRPLTAKPLDADDLAYRNARERQAHDLVPVVRSVKENLVYGTGIELTAEVPVASEQREYQPKLTVAPDGIVRNISCTCHLFRTQGLKQGPCAHVMALLLWHAERSQAADADDVLRVETRTFSFRDDEGEHITTLSIDQRQLQVKWGPRGAERLRVQNLWFDTVEDAQSAYRERTAQLERKGWLDASAS